MKNVLMRLFPRVFGNGDDNGGSQTEVPGQQPGSKKDPTMTIHTDGFPAATAWSESKRADVMRAHADEAYHWGRRR